MDCKEVRNRVLDKGASDETLAVHLSKCRDCSGFTTTLERFVKAKPDTSAYKVPRALDDSVTREACAWIESSSDPAPVGPSIRERLRMWPFIFACAACVFIVFWLVFAALASSGQSRDTPSGEPRSEPSDSVGMNDDRSFDADLSGLGKRLDRDKALTSGLAEYLDNPDAEIEFMLLEYLESDDGDREAVLGRLRAKLCDLHKGDIERQRVRLQEVEKSLSELEAVLDERDRDSDRVIDSEIRKLIEKYRK